MCQEGIYYKPDLPSALLYRGMGVTQNYWVLLEIGEILNSLEYRSVG